MRTSKTSPAALALIAAGGALAGWWWQNRSDEAALEAHRQTEHYRRCVALIDPMSESKRGKQYFEAIDVQDLA